MVFAHPTENFHFHFSSASFLENVSYVPTVLNIDVKNNELFNKL